MLLRLWSKATHKRITIPFRGYYTCLTCLRRFKVAWEGTTERGGTQPQRNRAKPEGLNASITVLKKNNLM